MPINKEQKELLDQMYKNYNKLSTAELKEYRKVALELRPDGDIVYHMLDYILNQRGVIKI